MNIPIYVLVSVTVVYALLIIIASKEKVNYKKFIIFLSISLMYTFVTIIFGAKFIDKPKEKESYEFIWDNKKEGLPSDGELIRINYSVGNKIYLGPHYRGEKE